MQRNEYRSISEPSGFKPIEVCELEISHPLPDFVPLDDPGDDTYQRAIFLVRLHNIPFGLLEHDFVADGTSSVQLAGRIWSQFGEQINQHLEEDGLPRVDHLPPGGLTTHSQPRCLSAQQELLKDAPMISVVIATRDRVSSLRKTLDSLLAVDYPHFEIVVVDNASKTDDTRQYVVRSQSHFALKDISLRYVREDVPGLAVAHNRGLEEVKGSIVAFTDDDVVIDKHWMAELWHGFNAGQSVGCVTGLVLPLELQTPAQWLFEQYGGFIKGFTQQIYDLELHRPSDPLFPYTAGRFGTGANMAFRTDLLRSLGAFDPALGIGTPTRGADDLAAFFLIVMHGYSLVYQPSALVYHQHRQDLDSLERQMYGYGSGLTAFITKCLIDNPKSILDIAGKVPAGIHYAIDPTSAKNKNKSIHYPPRLNRIERKGMLYGPVAYLLSRWQYRHLRKGFTDPAWSEHPSIS